MNLKRLAAKQALNYVKNGMVLGLGSGSTAWHFVDLLGKKISEGGLIDIQAVSTSEVTTDQARSLGIPLTNLAKHDHLDLAVDGADEVDPNLNLIKGLGRAALREKIVVAHSNQFVIIVDQSKMVNRLGELKPLPVEIICFEAEAHIRWLNKLGCIANLFIEDDGNPVITDNGNFLVLCKFPEGIIDPYDLRRKLNDRPGIVEHGLFLDLATRVIVASEDGIRELECE
jgi:ribose 5-phosphate isomerase A